MQWKHRRWWGGWRRRIWLAGWAGGVHGELCRGAKSPAEVRLWEPEIWSFCPITGKIRGKKILPPISEVLTFLMNVFFRKELMKFMMPSCSSQEELSDVIDIKNPEGTTAAERRQARLQAEASAFSPDHYLWVYQWAGKKTATRLNETFFFWAEIVILCLCVTAELICSRMMKWRVCWSLDHGGQSWVLPQSRREKLVSSHFPVMIFESVCGLLHLTSVVHQR